MCGSVGRLSAPPPRVFKPDLIRIPEVVGSLLLQMATTVLIVDDDEIFREELKKVLDGAGFSVRIAIDG